LASCGSVNAARAFSGSCGHSPSRCPRASGYREGSDFAFTDAHLTIPAQEWPRVRELARELGRVVHEAAERTSDGGTVRVSLTVAAFESE
jgi:hypothetical protein